MMSIHVLNRCAILFLIPTANGVEEQKKMYDQTWKIEKYFYPKKDTDYKLRVFQIKRETKYDEYNESDRTIIQTVIERYRSEELWRKNRFFMLVGEPPEGESILHGFIKGDEPNSIVD